MAFPNEGAMVIGFFNPNRSQGFVNVFIRLMFMCMFVFGLLPLGAHVFTPEICNRKPRPDGRR